MREGFIRPSRKILRGIKLVVRRKGEVLFLSVLMGMAGYLFYLTFSLSPSWYQPVGAADYSRFIFVLLEIVCGLRMFKIFRQAKFNEKSTLDNKIEIKRIRNCVLLTMLVIFIYLIGLTSLGYFISTFLFLVICMWILSYYSLKIIPKAILISIILVALLYILFGQILNIYFPPRVLLF